MKAAIARVTRKPFFTMFLGLASALSFGISVSAHTTNLTPTDRTSALQSVDLASGVDVQPAAAGSIPSKTDQRPTSAQALVNPGTEGGNTPGARSFLLIGLVLIGARLIISYRSRKVKNLATGTH
jgi:hypothetical protein